MGPGTIVRNSFIHHNGELGIAGGQADCSRAKGIVLENSELSYNNTAGYNWGWEAGRQWVHTDGLIVRNNYVHDNYGNGLWTDGFNINTVYRATWWRTTTARHRARARLRCRDPEQPDPSERLRPPVCGGGVHVRHLHRGGP